MPIRLSRAVLALGPLWMVGCGGSFESGGAPGPVGAESVFGPVATRAVGDGLRKPVIVSTSGATFVGLAGATFTNVALVNPPAVRVGEDQKPLGMIGSRLGDLAFTHPVTGRIRTVVATGRYTDVKPTVSPDGWRIAYLDTSGIRVVNMDGSGGATVKPSSPSYSLTDPSFAPDGGSIVYLQFDINQDYQIRRINVDGTNDRLVYDPSGAASCPTLTPDMTRVIYAQGASAWTVRTDGTDNRAFLSGTVTGLGFGSSGHLYYSLTDGVLVSKAGTSGLRLFPAADFLASSFAVHPQLPFVAFRRTEKQVDIHRATMGTQESTLVRSLPAQDGRIAFLPYRERRDVVAAGTADPQGAGFVASQFGRFAGSIVGWDAQNRAATAVVAEPVLSGSDSVVFTVDAGASNKITRVYSLDSIWEGKSVLGMSGPVDGLVITFDTATGLPGAIIPYIATRGSGKPKVTRLPGGGVRVEGELAGVYGEGGKLLSGPTDRYETQPSQP